jgi:hypothetical protein
MQRVLSTDVSEEYVASVFRVEKSAEHETRMKQIASIKSSSTQNIEAPYFFFLPNIGLLSAEYMALYPRRCNSLHSVGIAQSV